jgi:hypothetical protein
MHEHVVAAPFSDITSEAHVYTSYNSEMQIVNAETLTDSIL